MNNKPVRDPIKYPFGCKCQTLHHRVAGDGCDECQPQEKTFAQYLIDRKSELNRDQIQGRPGYITWEFIAKVILKRSIKTLYPWITGDAIPHPVVQEKVKADFKQYIERCDPNYKEKRKKKAYMRAYMKKISKSKESP